MKMYFRSVSIKLTCAFQSSLLFIEEVDMDTDSIPFVLDNSANFYTCNDKNYFINFEPLDPNMTSSITTVGSAGKPEGLGNMCLE